MKYFELIGAGLKQFIWIKLSCTGLIVLQCVTIWYSDLERVLFAKKIFQH